MILITLDLSSWLFTSFSTSLLDTGIPLLTIKKQKQQQIKQLILYWLKWLINPANQADCMDYMGIWMGNERELFTSSDIS